MEIIKIKVIKRHEKMINDKLTHKKPINHRTEHGDVDLLARRDRLRIALS